MSKYIYAKFFNPSPIKSPKDSVRYYNDLRVNSKTFDTMFYSGFYSSIGLTILALFNKYPNPKIITLTLSSLLISFAASSLLDENTENIDKWGKQIKEFNLKENSNEYIELREDVKNIDSKW